MSWNISILLLRKSGGRESIIGTEFIEWQELLKNWRQMRNFLRRQLKRCNVYIKWQLQRKHWREQENGKHRGAFEAHQMWFKSIRSEAVPEWLFIQILTVWLLSKRADSSRFTSENRPNYRICSDRTEVCLCVWICAWKLPARTGSRRFHDWTSRQETFSFF